MINLAGVRSIQNRIAQLQQQFGIPGSVPGMDFSRTLDKAVQSGAKTQTDPVQGTGSTGNAQNVQKAGSSATLSPAFPEYSLNRSLPLADQSLTAMVDEAARKYHVDPKLVSAIAEVESGGSQDVTSPAGAIGVMQLMPDTAADLGVNPYDKKGNIEGGAKYLRKMLDAFDGDVRRAVAAYNAGPQAVRDYGGVPPYQETQNYVNKVLDIYR